MITKSQYDIITDSADILKVVAKHEMIYSEDHMEQLLNILKQIWELDIAYDVYDASPLNHLYLSFELEKENDLCWGHGKELDKAIKTMSNEEIH